MLFLSRMLTNSFLAMLVVPGSIGIYQKLFQALFASVAVALIALHIKPTHTMGNEWLSRTFDRVSFVVFLVGYVAVKLTLPLAIRPL